MTAAPSTITLCTKCHEALPLCCPDPVVFVPLHGGMFAMVNWCDFERVARFKWYRRRKGKRSYAQANIRLPDGRHSTICMHQVILERAWRQPVDHINLDGLDNRRANLRACTPGQNTANASRRSNARQRFRGITKNKNFYEARSVEGGRVVYLGSFRTDVEAALAYDDHAARVFGRFARLNFGPTITQECGRSEPSLRYVKLCPSPTK